MVKQRGREPCPYRTAATFLLSIYILYLLYVYLTGKTVAFARVYDHILIKIFTIVLTIILIMRGDNIQAALLVIAVILTYSSFNRRVEYFEEKKEEEEKHEVEDMLDYAEFTDSPVGKAYNPKENYIGGIYSSFTGKLQYDQVNVVPP